MADPLWSTKEGVDPAGLSPITLILLRLIFHDFDRARSLTEQELPIAMGKWMTAGCEPEHTRRLGAICHRSMIAEQAEPELQVERAEPVPLAAMRAPALQRDE